MSNMFAAFAGISVAVIIVIALAVAPGMFMSANEDAIAANISNSSHNATYEAGTDVVIGWIAFNDAIVALVVIVTLSAGLAIVFRP
jgi:NADH:ubiquinone oxidoreductase subunit 3 (subunit A)